MESREGLYLLVKAGWREFVAAPSLPVTVILPEPVILVVLPGH